MVGVAEGHVQGIELRRLRRAQRLRGDDVTAGGKYLAAQLARLQLLVGIARQHRDPRVDLAAAGTDHHPGPGLPDAQCLAALENMDALPRRGARLPQAQVQGVQMATASIDQAADIGLATDHRGHLLARHHADRVAKTTAQQFIVVAFELAHVPGLEGHIHIAVLEIAVDTVACHPCGDDGVAAPTDVPEQVGRPGAELPQHLPVAAEPPDELAAVATRGAPADAMLFQYCHRVAALDQAQGGGNAGEAATADADIHLQLTLQRGIDHIAVAGGGVVGVWIGRFIHRGLPAEAPTLPAAAADCPAGRCPGATAAGAGHG